MKKEEDMNRDEKKRQEQTLKRLEAEKKEPMTMRRAETRGEEDRKGLD